MKELRVAKLDFLHWRGNPKYITAVIYLLLYSFYQLYSLFLYSKELGASIAPWVFPFLPCNGLNFLPIMLGFVLLVSDAPFRTRQQRFVMQRTGKRAWLTGQLLYILAVSVGFTAFMWVLSWVWLIPCLEWNGDWGAFLKTVSLNGFPFGYSTALSFPYSIIKNTNPVEVTLWCAGAMASVCFLLGAIMAFCNLWLRKGWGAVVIAILTAISVILDLEIQDPGPIRLILWISPLNWMNYSIMGHPEQYLPSHAFGILCPLLLGLGISAIMLLTIGKCDVETDKE